MSFGLCGSVPAGGVPAGIPMEAVAIALGAETGFVPVIPLPPGAAAALVQGGPALARNPEEGFLDSIDLLERSLEAGWPSPDQTWALNF